LCGPISPETPGGKQSFLLVVDDKSRYMWLVLLASKDQAAAAIIKLQARAEAEVGRKMGTLRTDRGGEFTAHTFGDYCSDQGIQRHLTAPTHLSKTAWWRGATRRCWEWPEAC
jgi:IS30 family transposase